MDVQIIIKAPNQSIADHTIHCDLNWTVYDLKNHLSNTYPSRPVIGEQKLIYSGQVLSDDLHLSDFLRYDDTGPDVHILHLVCSASTFNDQATGFPITNFNGFPIPQENVARRRYTPVPPPNPVYDEYRRRQEAMVQNVQSAAMNAASMPGLSPDAQLAAQMAAMQQMYAYYTTQYFQSLYPGQAVPYAPTPPLPNQAAAQPPNPAGLNAGNENDENGQRDWLDTLFLLCRIFVFFMLIYYYSSYERLLFVMIIAALIYFYYEGWLRDMPGNQNVIPLPGPENEQPLVNQEELMEDPNGGEHELEAAMDGDSPPHAPQPPPPNHLHMCFNFVSTFFTSLIPEPPPVPVNIN